MSREKNVSSILEGLNIINEASKKELVQGAEFTLNSNITLGYIYDKNNKTRDEVKDRSSGSWKWNDDFVEELRNDTGNRITISKSLTELKITPGCEIELISVDGKRYFAKIKGSKNIYFYLDPWNDLKKLEAKGTFKVKKEQGPILYAIYGTPDIYGRAGTQWHWTSKDGDETDKEFQNSVKYSAKRAAEREYREYDPRSIKTMYFRSEDEFLKQCKKLGINPKL